jgi:hypothetical protein
MPQTLEMGKPPAGIAVTAALEGENVTIETAGFYSSEDGNRFVERLEEVGGFLHDALDLFRIRPSKVDHLLAVFDKDGHAVVYCNELRFLAHTRRRTVRPTAVAKGQLLTTDDIVAVERLELHDAGEKAITVPPTSGVIFIFSHGWRKALFFDLTPLKDDNSPRTLDLQRLFGRFYNQLVFQEMFSTTEEQWARLFRWGWFPFIGLKSGERKNLLNLANFDRYMAPMLGEMCRSFCEDLDGRSDIWGSRELLAEQMPFVKLAIKHYRAGEYPSCICVLYPRVEGVMRKLFVEENPNSEPKSPEMVENLVENHPTYSTLLPARFAEYLRKVYFKSFDLPKGEVSLSRNSHAHGVSEIGEYDLIRASVGFMILDQIAYYLTD